MDILQLLLTMIVIILGISSLAFLNKKFELGLNDLSFEGGGAGVNKCELNKRLSIKEQEIGQLKARVKILEQLVTDPREQLKREINRL